MAKEKILVVDDEEDILELIRHDLSKERYHVTSALSGEIALDKARQEHPDLILMDHMRPGLDGLAVFRELKRDPLTRSTPIIMLSAKGEEEDIVVGLELGADDYIVKPFSPRILLARIKAVLRRRGHDEADDASISVNDLSIYPTRHEVLLKGVPITLTIAQFRILHLLAQRPGWVFSREKIINAVNGEQYEVTDRSVDVQIVGLRKKLGPTDECIQTVRGVGYKFKES